MPFASVSARFNTRPPSVLLIIFFVVVSSTAICSKPATAAGARTFAHSDSDKRYVHHIDLYDQKNTKITAESDQPYSPMNTCGRCHDYETIAHGWHFNAFESHLKRAIESEPNPETVTERSVIDGRPGEPWIWTDERTGTQLPLSYRDWPGRFNPTSVGITPFEMTRHFGARLPGGGLGQYSPDTISESPGAVADNKSPAADFSQRWKLTGSLEVDCMICHAVSGAYDFEQRREAIGSENFAWAPTAAIHLGTVEGSVARIKEGSDPDDEKVQAKLPKVVYDPSRFDPDGTVFMDLVRHVENNACYQCHSMRTVSQTGIDDRWRHDQDIHLRSGMNCTDCHRNGIDHHIVRGFENEENASGESVTTLSCVGCHLGTDFHLDEDEAAQSVSQREISNRPGRLGSPLPLHPGLPPIHFEKLACTACHSGPIPKPEAAGVMTSLSHSLGSKAHRTGDELPAIQGPVFLPLERVSPAKVMWPAFWGKIVNDVVQPLPPEKVYTATRRALRVRRGFIEEVTRIELSSRQLVELLGEDRGKLDNDQWTVIERGNIEREQKELGKKQFNEKVASALEAIEKELDVERAVYVSTGKVFGRGELPDMVEEVNVANPDDIGMVSWPMAHNVRPAGWSLGGTGCLECHADDGLIFASTLTPAGPAPLEVEPVSMASLQGIAESDRRSWNQLFGGRSMFKYLTAGSLGMLCLLMVLGFTLRAPRRHDVNALSAEQS